MKSDMSRISNVLFRISPSEFIESDVFLDVAANGLLIQVWEINIPFGMGWDRIEGKLLRQLLKRANHLKEISKKTQIVFHVSVDVVGENSFLIFSQNFLRVLASVEIQVEIHFSKAV